ncbi:FtsX-like permease family protein [Pseudodesulfovibrio tunisiensis]|uniref:FtsX-like permease family protein n=1 Tax=Pseudodesulfovibrio tunisiensis TaxID=463192 RepID=UPI001FB25C4D|nr:FtsX-like permease family protein [Pseudodesulfovibrio tunisiensis]
MRVCRAIGPCLLCLGLLLMLAGQGRAADSRFLHSLVELGDRSLGTPGLARAADLVEAEFRRVAPENSRFGRQAFHVPALEEGGAWLIPAESGKVITLKQLRVNALSPGAIEPPGLDGPLIYAGQGRTSDFNGMEVLGAIVLLDMDSGKNWNNAALLGARSLIFVAGAEESGPVPRAVFNPKFELTPVDLPMFWMSRAEAREAFGTGFSLLGPHELGRARISSRAEWSNVEAHNVWCLIPGTDRERELLVLEAFYDTGSWVAGDAPGADEGTSIAELVELAAMLGRQRPERSVLLLATAGRGSAQVGMREFTWGLVTKGADLRERRDELETRVNNATRVLELLNSGNPFSDAAMQDRDTEALLKTAFRTVVRNAEDDLTNDLMRLRLMANHMGMVPGVNGPGMMHNGMPIPGMGMTRTDMPGMGRDGRIRRLAARRRALKSMNWVQSTGPGIALDKRERALLRDFFRDVARDQTEILADATGQLADMASALELREALDGRSIVAHVSLYLSSHGRGVGGFDKGWLYDLMPDVNRTAFLRPMDAVVKDVVAGLGDEGRDLFHDTLRPGRRAWQGFLPDNPELGAEPMALAGFPAITLATVFDVRPAWGTPQDVPERVNFAYLKQQSRLVSSLVRGLANRPVEDAGERGKNHFSTLTGRANLLRKGEVFPDRPGTDMVVLAFQWTTRLYGMVDTGGHFRIPGLADRKVSYHKAVIEGFRFDPLTGLAAWAIDKPKTGKDAYRVKIKRRVQATDLILFGCAQTTAFSMIEPRTFRYLYRPMLIDARTEAPPVSYWYSRMDTRSSTLGTLFLEPDTPVKLTLSDTVLDRKVLLLNARPDDPQGKGYVARNWPVIPLTEYRAARDMWSLLEPRISSLEERGIINDRIRELRRLGRDDLERAEAFRSARIWDEFLEASRASLAKASRVYGDVDKTQRDVLIGVLFYVALFVPFAYCMERLFFSFVDIKKRIAAFLGFLGLIIGVVYMVHPAFQLTYSPMVVILAFFILALSLLVAMIIFLRFEREMVELQKRSRHVKLSGISPAAAFAAAFRLGVGNLKRRPVRTFLTFLTLTILTFTIMNFTTVKSVRQKGWANFSPHATYTGLFMKYFNWTDLPEEALEVVENAFRGSGVVAPRTWYDASGITGDKSRAPDIPVTREGREALARGLVGLSAAEPEVSGMDRILVKGRWFRPGERHVVLLPERIAEAVNVDPDDPRRSRVDVWGVPLTVVGVFSDQGLRDNPDLDGEPITPIVFPNLAASRMSEVEAEAIEDGEDVMSSESRYQHIPGYETLIIPARDMLRIPAGRLKGIAIRAGAEARAVSGELGDRFGMLLFRGGPSGTSLFYSADAVSYSGVSNILIPLAISILIVLNTMIGSVYERKPEIAVYTSVGLAPPHVAFLFIAEALAFAVISVVAGYLVAQGAAFFLAGTPVWAGMTANYSSTSGVAAMVLVMGVVLLSAVYPARVAARIAIPDVNRSWVMPKAQGNTLTVVLPFLIKLGEQASAGGFLVNYYQAHYDVSHGAFCTDDMQCGFLDINEDNLADVTHHLEELARNDVCFSLKLRVWLAPFDFGVRQQVRLIFCPSDLYSGFRQVKVELTREAGEHKAWENLNRTFLNDLRKQLLAWRSLDDEAVNSFADDLGTTLDRERKAMEDAK